MTDRPTEARPDRAREGGGEAAEDASAAPASDPAAASSAAALRLAQAHPDLQPDPLARLFISIAGIVVAHNRGQFALECWQLKDLCRETRYIEGVTQPGTVDDLIFQGCRLSGVSALLREARGRKRGDIGGAASMTQLMCAARANDVERVRLLLRLGCPNANARDQVGFTALHWACLRGHDAAVRELLAHNVDANLTNDAGWTPLFAASFNGRLSVVRLLCDAPGIDLAARTDDNGLSALGWALRNDQTEVAAVLRARGVPE